MDPETYFDPFANKEQRITPPAGVKVPAAKYFDPFTGEEGTYLPRVPTAAERGEKMAKAEYESIIGPAKKAYEILTGKSKAPLGEKIKGVLTSPLYTVSGVIAAPITAGMAGTGLDEAFGRAFQKYVPEKAQEPAATALEIAGALGMKGAKLSPVKMREVNIKGVSKGIKEGQNASAVKIAEEEIMPAIAKHKEMIQSEVYQPMREALKQVKTRGFVGKIAAKAIKKYAAEMKLAGKLNANEEKMLSQVAADVEKWNTLDTLLNRRQAYDRQFSSLYPAGADVKNVGFASKLAGDTRKIITKTIRDFIGEENSAVLKQFDEANNKYSELINNLDELEGAIKKDPTKFFEQGIVSSGIKRSRAITEAAGRPVVMKGAYKYLTDEVMENGVFRAKKFQSLMNKIPDEVGAEIFGPDWAEIQTLKQIVNRKLSKPLPLLARKMQGIPAAALDLLVDSSLQKLINKGSAKGLYDKFPHVAFEPRSVQSTIPAQTRMLAEEARKEK